MKREAYKPLIVQALESLGRTAEIWLVSKHIWDNYVKNMSQEDKSFYNWQYDIRWAANTLRREGTILSSPRGCWSLVNN